MTPPDIASYALGNLRRHKLRTFLTCAGVAVGVATLTVMVSLGTGLEEMITRQFDQEELTTRITVLRAGAQRNPFEPRAADAPKGPPITDEVIERLGRLPGVLVAYPDLTTLLTVEAGEQVTSAGAYGLPRAAITESYRKALLAGDYWEGDGAQAVCVLPSRVLSELGFARPADALGQTVFVSAYMNLSRYGEVHEQVPDPTKPDAPPRDVVKYRRPSGLEGTELTVVGVYDSDQYGYMGRQLHVPLDTARQLIEDYPIFRFGLEEGEYRAALVKVVSHNDLDAVEKRIQKEGFATQTVFDILGVIRVVFVVFQLLLSFFGGIGLFVAFFGIANTMVMAVLERVREIGVLKALGATRFDIAGIFVVEASTIGFAGGALGVGFGWAVGKLLNFVATRFVPPEAGIDSLELFYVPPWLVVAALCVSTFVALVAGLYPAWRAARQDPVVALRRE
ncbi:MAG: ABC transporter permease [Planctomycetota bacterium]|nr:MAG: ABC transporter permease [Planctomycetota bacterium]